jgi:hypothetical protein
MNPSWHSCCKFNKFYQIHAKKMSWVHHRSKPLMTTDTTNKCTQITMTLKTTEDTFSIRGVQIYNGRTFLRAFRLGLLLSTKPLRGCKEWSECRSKAVQEWIKENLRDFFYHHDTIDAWKPSAVVIGLFTPIQAIATVEGQIEEWRGFADTC